jgi:DNA-binding CsgD family transcriptional regulator
MSLLKSIVIGCDDTVTLSAILNNIQEAPGFMYNVISAARISDLASIARSLEPDLVILCFRNNQSALNDFDLFARKPATPLMCLTRKGESEALRWTQGRIVFTYAVDFIAQTDYLTSRIHSIFLLKGTASGATSGRSRDSLAAAAMEQHHDGQAKNLSRYVLELDQKVEVLLRVKESIAELYPRVDDETRMEMMSIVNAIKGVANDNKLWDDFKVYFERTNPGFLLVLASKHPELTPKDLKYCCYLKMNMSNDDIRNLLGINQESVRTHKYRLKKKMDLPRELDLETYLRTVDHPAKAQRYS